MFNRNITNEIIALTNKVKILTEELQAQLKINHELKEEIANLKGEKRKADMFCRGCKHFIVSPMIVEDGYVAMLDKKAYECALNRTCKDFDEKDKTDMEQVIEFVEKLGKGN